MATNWGGRTKPAEGEAFLLKEDGDFLLLETGDKILLTRGGGEWNTRTKPTLT